MRPFRTQRRIDVRRHRKPAVRGTLMTETELFAAALEKATPEARAAYLTEACAGDEKLRRRVEALLRAHAEPDEILDRPAPSPLTAAYVPQVAGAISEGPGTVIGPF